MSGSEQTSKRLDDKYELQLPLKGMMTAAFTPHKKRTMLIEGMGDGRFRIHVRKGQPGAK